MAKKNRSRAKRPAARTPAAPASAAPAITKRATPATPVTPPADEPVFWFGFEVSWAKLVLARVVLFALLAADALLQIRHAPRYGAGGFNVAHLPGLDALGATRASYGIAELVNAYLFVLIACGIATRWLLPIATAIYAWLYFGSQLDSYQHHYLVAMLLVLACFVPWRRPAGATPETPVRAWAVRVILVELAILYLWAAISKLDPAWIDGTTLGGQITGTLRSVIDATVGIKLASVTVIGVELVLAATVWLKPAWRIAAPLGLALHLGIVASGLEIGLFAWLMIGLYVLVVPDRIWIALAATAPIRALRHVAELAAGRLAGPARWAVVVVGLGVGVVLAATCRFESSLATGVVATIAVALAIAMVNAWGTPARVAWIAAGHLLALATWFAIDRASSIAYDYYKFWGGNSRRFKDPEAAEHAYRRLIAIAPADPNGHYQLGRVLLDREATDDGLAELHEAQRLDSHHARAYVQEARWLATHGRMPEAIDKAREAVKADPADTEASRLLTMLQAGTKPTTHDDHD